MKFNSEKPAVRTTMWYGEVEFDQDGPTSEDASGTEGLVLIANAAKRVWEELYVCKKPVCSVFHKSALISKFCAFQNKLQDVQYVTYFLMFKSFICYNALPLFVVELNYI